MAAVDKFYATKNEYSEFLGWCIENYKKALPFFRAWIWNDDDRHAIANFPEYVDKYLVDNCPIEFIVEFIREQYE